MFLRAVWGGHPTRGTARSLSDNRAARTAARRGRQIAMSLHNISTANAHCACSIGRGHGLS